MLAPLKMVNSIGAAGADRRVLTTGLFVLRTQAGEVNAERGAVDHPPFSLDHHPVCGMGAAEDARRQRIQR